MRFLLTTTGRIYEEEQKTKLETLGFEFSKHKCGEHIFAISDKKVYIEIDSLQDLVDFSDKWGQIIVDGDVIEIYDDYRE